MFIKMTDSSGQGRAWMLEWTLKCITFYVLLILRVSGGHGGL